LSGFGGWEDYHQQEIKNRSPKTFPTGRGTLDPHLPLPTCFLFLFLLSVELNMLLQTVSFFPRDATANVTHVFLWLG